jgi:A/G-specific adenine glycosylase
MISASAGPVHAGLLPPEAERTALQRRILGWFRDNGRDLPWRRTLDPYAILVSEVMLQQTQVPRVIPRFEALLERFPSPAALAGAAPADVLAMWSGLGYNNRAVRLRECCRLVVERHGGALPDQESALLALPGVGRYTARALLVFAWNRDVAAVDTNVRRVLVHELGLDPTVGERELETVAAALVPKGRSREWHHALMDYGSIVATARRTGVAPRRPQTPFRDSRRWLRGAILRELLGRGGALDGCAPAAAATGCVGRGTSSGTVLSGPPPVGAMSVAMLARALDVGEERVREAVAGLVRDGLVAYGPDGDVRLETNRGPGDE